MMESTLGPSLSIFARVSKEERHSVSSAWIKVMIKWSSAELGKSLMSPQPTPEEGIFSQMGWLHETKFQSLLHMNGKILWSGWPLLCTKHCVKSHHMCLRLALMDTTSASLSWWVEGWSLHFWASSRCAILFLTHMCVRIYTCVHAC